MTMFYFVGQIGDSIVMAGIGMGYIIMSACSTAFCFGMNGTLENKVSQAFGDKSYEECGLWLNRGRLICTVIMIPVSFLFINSHHLLKAIGQDE